MSAGIRYDATGERSEAAAAVVDAGLDAHNQAAAPLAEGVRLDSGVAEAENAMALLGTRRDQPVEHAYVDLLRAR